MVGDDLEPHGPTVTGTGELHFERAPGIAGSLQAAGINRAFTGRLDGWHYEPLAETRRVALEIRRRIVDRHQRRLGAAKPDPKP